MKCRREVTTEVFGGWRVGGGRPWKGGGKPASGEQDCEAHPAECGVLRHQVGAPVGGSPTHRPAPILLGGGSPALHLSPLQGSEISHMGRSSPEREHLQTPAKGRPCPLPACTLQQGCLHRPHPLPRSPASYEAPHFPVEGDKPKMTDCLPGRPLIGKKES